MKKTFEIKGEKTVFSWLCAYLGNLFFWVCLFIAVALVTFSLSLVECEVTGTSMQPTYNKISGDKHDLVYVNKYDNSLGYGDTVVIETAGGPIIKRIIGMTGDTFDVVFHDGEYKLEKNGEVLEEDYIYVTTSALVPTYAKNGMNAMADRWVDLKDTHSDLFNAEGKLVVGENKVFALGDNRKVSLDSSTYGTFDMAQVSGKVEITRYYGESEFDFYFNYVMQGKFINTIINIFR